MRRRQLAGVMLLLCVITDIWADENKTVINEMKLPLPFAGSQPTISMNSSNPPFPISHNTSHAGTTEQPTLNGGILNTSQSNIHSATQVKVPTLEKNIPISTFPITLITKKEDWATSAKLQMLLMRIAREGKLDTILKQAQHHGLPASVALLPIVESNFKNNALSPKGAAGAWQLMPALAKDYDLPLAQRFDFSASTQVALQHLHNLYRQFGDWELVYAAYHAGAGRVKNAIRKNPKFKYFEDLDLPLETQRYVKQLKTLHLSLTEKN